MENKTSEQVTLVTQNQLDSLKIHLEDLIVDAPFRGAGIGRALLRTLAEFALAQGAHRLHWEVLDWNQPAVKFYQALGAEIASHWWPCRMDRQAMEHFAHG
jgi:GNAT superfamily N-acetyltransferase